MLFTVSNRNQGGACPFSPSLWVRPHSDSSVIKVLYNYYSPSSAALHDIFLCAFIGLIKYQVKPRQPKTRQTREPPPWVLQGAKRKKYSDLSSFSVAHGPILFTNKVGSWSEHELNDRDNRQQPVHIYIFISKGEVFRRGKCVEFSTTMYTKT